MRSLELRQVDVRDFQSANHFLFVSGVCEAFSTHGFLQVVGHGITRERMEQADRITEELFSLPRDVLMRYARPGIMFQRGYAGYGAETAKDSEVPDLKDFFQVRCQELPADPRNNPFGENIFPTEVPQFREMSLFLLGESLRVGRAVLWALEEGFDLSPGSLVGRTVGAETIQRTIHYRPLSAFSDAAQLGAWRAAPHRDINLATAMPCANAKGLVLKLGDVWFETETVRDSMIVDTGEMLRLVPGLESLQPTTHAVMNPEGADLEKSRSSYPVFIHGILYGNMIRSAPESDELVDYAVPFLRRIKEITRKGV